MTQIQINHGEYQKKVKKISVESLKYIIQDASEAIQANPEGHKAGYYQDEINYCSMELRKRLS